MRESDSARGNAEVVSLSQTRLRQAGRRILHLRQLREHLFGPSFSREVAWDILLSLYVYERRFTIGDLTKTVGAPHTTVLRWLDFLGDREMIERVVHPTDRRATLVALSGRATVLIDTYLQRVLA